MTLENRVEFINDLCEIVRRNIIRQAERFPEEWDGHELRQIVADHFNRHASMSDHCMKDKRGKRRRKYDHTVIVENL